MGEALLSGVIAAGWATPAEVVVAEIHDGRRRYLSEEHGVRAVATAREAAESAPTAILAVKPIDVPSVLAEVAGAMSHDGLLISIAAGIPPPAPNPAFAPGARLSR